MKNLAKSGWIVGPAMSILLIGCGNQEEKISTENNDRFCLGENFKDKVEFVSPQSESVTEGISLTGSVEANPDKVIQFVSLAGGIISSTYFSLGDKVTKGQVLAELRSTELSDLHSQSKSAESQIKVAEKRLQASQSMFDDGISSQRDLMQSQSELDILKAEREKINANLSLFSASTQKGVFQIKAPSSGIITSKSIAAGMQISAGGDPLFTISDLNEVWVMVNIYASSVRNITPGMEVGIKTLSYPDEVFKGKIAVISQVLDAEAKVLKARVLLPNGGLKLKPGMLVDVMALKQTNESALSIPTTALVFNDNQNFVVVYKSDCDVEIRKVAIRSSGNGNTFLAEGLAEGEKIISKNQLLVYEQIKNFQN